MDRYTALAALFDYPAEDYGARVRRAADCIRNAFPEPAARLDAFLAALPDAGDLSRADALTEVQEVFTRSFDVQPITTLSVGYLMFGDDYKRGELMVQLGREQRECGVDCGGELPDHLPNVLRLLAVWGDRAVAEEFVGAILVPAMERMLAEFAAPRSAQRDRLYLRHFRTLIDVPGRATLFEAPLRAVLAVLQSDFEPEVAVHPAGQNEFLRSVVRELQLESEDGDASTRSGTV
jgi:nitrate reductase assembly molybdenum cofactor insertion protein NarJ